ncbi:vanillic acid non-oxidative decarboxylation gene [Moorella thermoacetica]|uniref:Phenolic acid decarboxylase subunit D n=2 Tax=Neomoorella thermoacetica TaxID=1525 RepID=A0A1J5NVU8_NEOTH|nr:phenolic acid decarboxylase subunit D [Moorella thermoacetica]AKX95774.1 phenolic acid decarboxylase subunit D [Moorella thermoacetica]APC07473.1 phenolic acid decarboxylase subunit D [Moorella thermoacetica]OIQ07600.1 phenolic acid decarboxylase subunit D [Moorella thermoacetica]OIQ52921.1 phenolic acid decarboxylase subunit D [Moorella thermoacetica]
MICPRCDQDTAEKLVDSPRGQEWSVYLCHTCYFSWRSTEDESITDPRFYSTKFKLSPDSFEKMLCIPPVPPLKST